MAKFVHDNIMDAGLNEVKTKADKLIICEGQPATYANATTLKSGGGNKLAEVAIDSSDFTGPANGDVSGRKITLAQQAGITIDESGTADHVAVVDDGGTTLQQVTTISNSQAVTAGNTATVSAFDHEILDVTP